MKYSVCLLAAGKGTRTQLSYNKVLYSVQGKTVLDHSLELFLKDEECAQIVLACSEADWDAMEPYLRDERIERVLGGATRQQSVYAALHRVCYPYVFIHDAARPYLRMHEIELCKQTLEKEDACLLMVPATDTVKVVKDGYVKSTLDRSSLYQAQTPQCFLTSLILTCHEYAKRDQKEATDDAQLVEWYSQVPVKVVLGDSSNKKITVPADLK